MHLYVLWLLDGEGKSLHMKALYVARQGERQDRGY